MRILQVAANAGYGGLPLHVRTLASGLADRGHEVRILSMSDGPMLAVWREAGLQAEAVPSLGRRLPLDPRIVLRVNSFLRDFIDESKPDLVHAHGPRAALFLDIAMRSHPRPALVATAHGSFTQFALGHEAGFGAFTAQARELRYRAVDWLTGRVADRFIAVSEATGQNLVTGARVPPQKVVVIHNGIPAHTVDARRRAEVREELGCGPEERLAVFVGRLAYHKGAGILIEAAAEVARLMPSARFVVVGEGPMEGQVAARAAREPLAGRMTVLGRRSDAIDLVAAGDLFVLPSLSEGLPLTLLEAAMCGRAMVGSDVGGIPEVVLRGKTGLLAPPGDISALAADIIALLENDEARQRMGAAARRLWEKEFTAGHMLDSLEDLYRDVTESCGQARSAAPARR